MFVTLLVRDSRVYLLKLAFNMTVVLQKTIRYHSRYRRRYCHCRRSDTDTVVEDGIEDTEHFLELCLSFDIQRRDLLAGVSELLRPFVQINTLPNNVLVQYLLYGNKELPDDVNKHLVEFTPNFIHKTGRLG